MKRSNEIYWPDKGIMKPGQVHKMSKVLLKYMMENPDGVELPGNIGVMRIIGEVSQHKVVLDKKKSSDYNRRIYHTNPDTDGYYFKVEYNQSFKGLGRRKRFKYGRQMTFRPNRPVKEAIFKKLTEDPYHFHRLG